jgi:GAF domain-containing protein
MSGQDETTNSTTKLNAELLAMVRIASSILQYSKLDDILTTITRELAQLIQFDRSSLALLAPDQKSLLFHPIYAGPAKLKTRQARRFCSTKRPSDGSY